MSCARMKKPQRPPGRRKPGTPQVQYGRFWLRRRERLAFWLPVFCTESGGGKEEHMAGKMAEIGKWAVFCLLTGLALLLAGPVLLGLRPQIVVSGSMEPAVPGGSLAYIRPSRDAEAVREGDGIV